MARIHLSTAAVARIFERTTSPVFIIGFDRSIRYLNAACADWVQIVAEEAVKAKCIYTSENLPDGLQEKLSGICPPPTLFETGENSTNHIGSFFVYGQAENGQPRRRSASAFRLYEPESEEPLILVIASTDQFEIPTPGNPATDAIHDALREMRQLSSDFFKLTGLLGTSLFANRVRRQALMASQSESDLLIVGEPGSGREHLARTIHSVRAEDSESDLIPIQCSVADQQIIQRTIGDMLTRRKARTPLPSSSRLQDCLLLLDVDRLNRAAQAELLGFLQLPEFPLLLISTASKRLTALANQSQFEPELASYLQTMTIELLPLSMRLEDLPILAQAILESVNRQREQQLAGFDSSAMQLFQEYHWPRNLDELKEVATAAALQATSSRVTAVDLPKKFHDSISAMRIGSAKDIEINLEDYLQSIEKELLIRSVHQAKGNKTKAAKLLGISRAKLLRKLQRFGVQFVTASSPSSSDIIEPSEFEEID